MQPSATPDRRTVVTAGAIALAGGGALAACSSDAGTATSSATSGSAASSPASSPAVSASTTAASGTSGAAIVRLGDVPVGGAVSATSAGAAVVVAQPTPGKVVAFSAVCPHQGCKVRPASGTYTCPCHGSRFETSTGKVINGPAAKDLTPVEVKVVGQDVVAG